MMVPDVELSAITSPPPCSSASCLAMGRPRPVPFTRVVKSGSKTRSRSGAEMPGP